MNNAVTAVAYVLATVLTLLLSAWGFAFAALLLTDDLGSVWGWFSLLVGAKLAITPVKVSYEDAKNKINKKESN